MSPKLLAMGMPSLCSAMAALLFKTDRRFKSCEWLEEWLINLPLNEVVWTAHDHQNGGVNAVQNTCICGR